MSTEEERIEQLFSALVKASNAVLLKSFDRTRSYAEVVDDYRQLEAEFVAQIGDDDFSVLETKRHIAASIFSLANSYKPSLEACREAWNGRVHLGFTSLFMTCMESWLYADICAADEQPEEGLAVLEPLIAVLEQRLEEARATQRPTIFYEDKLEPLRELRNELETQRRGQRSPGRITRRTYEAYKKTYGLNPEAKRIDEVYAAMLEARRAVYRAFARSRHRTFAEIADDYRQVEADVLARIRACDPIQGLAGNVRRRIAEDGFLAACGLELPFDVCRQAWNEVVRLGFSSKEARLRIAAMYAESCLFNNEPEAGLAVIEPLMAQLIRLVKKPRKRLFARKRTRVELKRELEDLTKLRDKLKAQRKAREAST